MFLYVTSGALLQISGISIHSVSCYYDKDSLKAISSLFSNLSLVHHDVILLVVLGTT